MKNIFSKYFYPILILVLVGFLGFKNYATGTILSGWDTLHPEFNFPLYLSRILSGVWQEHQGIGAVAAQSHASELTRVVFPYLLSLFFSQNLVRYIFIFTTLAVGGLGIYFLSKYILSISFEKSVKPAAFLASVFYILNLATLQQYFNPLEMFTVHFATLPWLFLLAIKFLRDSKKKTLIWFSVVTIFSSSIAHTATLFYVYFTLFSVFVLTAVFLNRSKGKLKRGLILMFLTFVLNLFWLGPNIYYVLRESHTVSNSQISRTFSTEAFLQSKAFGNLKDLGLLKNFPFNWREYNFESSSFEDQMASWIPHLKSPLVIYIGYGVMTFAVLGILIAFFRKSRYALSFLPLTIICVFFWINENPPFTAIFTFLRQNIPIFSEALRFPFTKFSILLISTLSIFFAFSAHFVLEILRKVRLRFIFVISIILALIYLMLPAFKGNFIDSSMRVKAPQEYFEMFDWFNSQNHSARVAMLPIQSFWNWSYHSWGYQGGGFTWFGIPQPTLNREFDRWGLYNEDFYYQSSGALYSGNTEAFKNTLKKYQVKYLLLDESVINAGGTSDVLYIPQIKNMVASTSGDISEVAKFNLLTVYETNFDIGDKYITAPKKYSNINTDMTYAKVDPIYATYGDYVESGETSFPFINLDGRGVVKVNIGDDLTLKNSKTGDEIHLNTSDTIKVDLSANNGFDDVYNCDLKKSGLVERVKTGDGVLYKAEDGGVSCDFINFPDLKYPQAYILRIAGENRKGRSLKIYLTNYKTEKTDLEELLPEGKFDKTYSIYPSILKGSGYTLNLETRSYGKVASENLISKIEFYPVDYATLSTSQGETFQGVDSINNNLKILNVKKYGTWGYKVETQGSGLIELGQGYEKGWIAFQLPINNLEFKILEHIKVNSWANGWLVPSNSPSPFILYIVFWPQLLEWGGFLVGGITLLVLFLKRR